MTERIEPPPEGLGPDDLAVALLLKMGVGWTQQNGIAASDALRIKAAQPGFNIQKAWVFILKQWTEYKASPNYRSKFRSKAANWLTEGDYDNPQIWGGRPILAYQEKPKQLSEVEQWRRDKELHPENYPTPAEHKEFVKQMDELLAKLSGKTRMPDGRTPAVLKQKDATDCSTVGSREKPLPNENNGPQQ